MPYPEFAAGQTLTAAMLTAMQPLYSRQTSDQTVTSSTTLVDSQVSVLLAASAEYAGRLVIAYSAAEAADIKFALSGPSGTTVQRKNILYTSGASAGVSTGQSVAMRQRSITTEQEVGGTGVANYQSYSEDLNVSSGATAGMLTLQFAQNSSNATGSILRSDSYLLLWRVA